MNKNKIIGEVHLHNGKIYSYTDCTEYVDAIKEELKKHGLIPYEAITFDTQEEWERFHDQFTESKNKHPVFYYIKDALQYTFDNFVYFRTLTLNPYVIQAVEAQISCFYEIYEYRSIEWYREKFQIPFLVEEILDFLYAYSFLSDSEYERSTLVETMTSDIRQNGVSSMIGNFLKTVIKSSMVDSEFAKMEKCLDLRNSQTITMIQDAHYLICHLRLLHKEYIYMNNDHCISARIIYETPDTVTLERYQNYGNEQISNITIDRDEFENNYTPVSMIPEIVLSGKHDFGWYIPLYFNTIRGMTLCA